MNVCVCACVHSDVVSHDHSCNVSVLYGHQTIAMAAIPSTWPSIPTTVTMQSPVQWQYYMNVCTHSYSAAWWDWERWQVM